jgi:hypothetical protein
VKKYLNIQTPRYSDIEEELKFSAAEKLSACAAT